MNIDIDFDSLKGGKLEIKYSCEDFFKVVSFDVPLDFFISSDSLVALSIACRPLNFKVVDFSFSVTSRARDVLLRDYKIELGSNCQLQLSSDNVFFGFDCSSRVLGQSKRLLSFSGGVDSLAAHYLCGPDAQLLSLEFGGHFKRESDFFKRWDTKIIRTDFRNKPFDENLDWRFMAAGAILMSDFIGVESLLFGTVLEASPFWFNVKTKTPYENARMYQVFELADIKIGQTVTSLSEYGTTKVASSFGREILSSSIESAAAKGSSKLFRKLLLEKIVFGDEITNDWASLNKPKNKSISGKSFPEDILSLYFSWKLGATFVSEYILDMSDDFKSAADTLDMGFFEKYNPENLVANPPDLRDRFVTIFRSLDLLPYSESDYENINAVREFLSGYFRL